MRQTGIRWVILAGLIAFVPLAYYLAVVVGLLPYAGILLITLRNLTDYSLLLFGLIHLVPYGAALYWIAGRIARLIERRAGNHAWAAVTVVFVALAGVGALPLFGAAHGHVHWTSAYAMYFSGKLRWRP